MSLLGLILLTLPPSGEGKPPTNIHMALTPRTTVHAVARASSPWSDAGNSAIPSELFFPVLFLSISFPNSWQAGGQAALCIDFDGFHFPFGLIFSHFCNRVTIPTLTNKNRPDGWSVVFSPFTSLICFIRSEICLHFGDGFVGSICCCGINPAKQASQQFSKPASSSKYPSIHPLNDVA
jgi:hypothetical protein